MGSNISTERNRGLPPVISIPLDSESSFQACPRSFFNRPLPAERFFRFAESTRIIARSFAGAPREDVSKTDAGTFSVQDFLFLTRRLRFLPHSSPLCLSYVTRSVQAVARRGKRFLPARINTGILGAKRRQSFSKRDFGRSSKRATGERKKPSRGNRRPCF